MMDRKRLYVTVAHGERKERTCPHGCVFVAKGRTP